MAITDFTDAIINQGIAGLYAAEASTTQLVAEQNMRVVDETTPGGKVIKEFVPFVDGSTTALTRNTPETASGSQSSILVEFEMHEYGKGTDAVTFPWREFLTRALNPQAYAVHVQGVANKAITAADQLGAVPLRDSIGGGTNAAYTHPLGPDDLGDGVMGFSSPLASKLIRYGTQTTTRLLREDITEEDVITWDFVQSMQSTMRSRKVRPLTAQAGTPIYALIAAKPLIDDVLASLAATKVYPNLLDTAMRVKLAELGIGIGLIGLFNGVLLIESQRMVYSAAGAGGIDVYPAVMVGADFLAKAALSPAAMPQRPADGDLIPVGEGSCVIVQPSYGGVHSNRTGTIAWYGYMGYGIFDPRSYCRLECASTSANRF